MNKLIESHLPSDIIKIVLCYHENKLHQSLFKEMQDYHLIYYTGQHNQCALSQAIWGLDQDIYLKFLKSIFKEFFGIVTDYEFYLYRVPCENDWLTFVAEI